MEDTVYALRITYQENGMMRHWMRIAHRGASGIAPENTLAAFSKAIEIGVDGVELDVHGTADGEVVVMHDASLDRTTDGTGAIKMLTLDQIKRADAGAWFGSQFAGERVPTLAESLDLIKGQAITVLEIKDKMIAAAVVSVIHQMQATDEVFVISFHPSILVEIRALDSRIPTGLLIGGGLNGVARRYAIHCVHQMSEIGCSTLNVSHNMVTAEFAYQVRRRGVNLWTWTVDDSERMRALIDFGVDGITSNYPERFGAI
jgi:glycerophosphoryl diester phosphodiesterase